MLNAMRTMISISQSKTKLKNNNTMLSKEQIQEVVNWMNGWEQLKGTAIPLRFKEEFLAKQLKSSPQPSMSLIDEIRSIGKDTDEETLRMLQHNFDQTINKIKQVAKFGSTYLILKANEIYPQCMVRLISEGFKVEDVNTPPDYTRSYPPDLANNIIISW